TTANPSTEPRPPGRRFQKRGLHITAFSCNQTNTPSTENFNWLVGDWTRLNAKENQSTFEHWIQENPTLYQGFSYTLQGTDTVWQEHVQLIKEQASWSLNITGQGESTPTKFSLTNIQSKGFLAENPDNEFPKKIKYQKVGNKLEALISAGDLSIRFEFAPIKE
ncbi:MAG: hypothetical protein AAF598_22220, partial [Bacteroidota bacterium]